MIMPLFTYCGSVGLGWPDSKLQRLHSIDKRSMNLIKSKCPPNTDLRIPSILNQMKKSVCKFVFNCIQENICDPYRGYVQRSNHEKVTRNNSNSLALPLLTLKSSQKLFALASGEKYNEGRLKLRLLSPHS